MSNGRLGALALAALMVGAAPVQAQQTSRPPQQRPAAQQQQQTQQMQRLHQQMTQMQQHMQQLRERIHVVDQDLDRTMDRIRDRDLDRDRLREHQALRNLAADLGSMTRQMEQNATRLRETVQNRLFQDDPQLRQEMERLRDRYRTMDQQMEQSVQALERMQKRLGQVADDDS